MSTCAIIAFIDWDKFDKKYVLYISEPFNGDMGPEMDKGEKLIEYYNSIYLNKRNHDAKYCKMVKIIKKLTDDFGYDRDLNLASIPLKLSNDGNVHIDFRTVYYYDNKFRKIDLRKDIWSTWFYYSDYLYLIPLCNVSNVFIHDEDDDGESHEYRLTKDYMYVFCFREFFGCVDPIFGKYVNNNFDEDEVFEKYFENLSNEISAKNDQTSDKLINEFHDTPEPKKYVEIISQYRNGDRDFIVARTNDNKHVIFKEMK